MSSSRYLRRRWQTDQALELQCVTDTLLALCEPTGGEIRLVYRLQLGSGKVIITETNYLTVLLVVNSQRLMTYFQTVVFMLGIQSKKEDTKGNKILTCTSSYLAACVQ